METNMFVFTAHDVTEQVSFFLFVDLLVPTQVLLGHEFLATLFARVSRIFMPSIVMVEFVSLFEELATLVT